MPFNRRQMLQLMTSLAVTTACPAMAWEPEFLVELELLFHAMPGQDAYFRQVAEAFTAKNPKNPHPLPCFTGQLSRSSSKHSSCSHHQ